MNVRDIFESIYGKEPEDGQTKTASAPDPEEDLEKVLSDLLENSFDKLAATTSSPEEMVENTDEELSEEDVARIQEASGAMGESADNATRMAKQAIKQNILQAGTAVVQDAISELSQEQQVKVASVASIFESDNKKLLFAKLAAKRLKENERIVTDMDFAQYVSPGGDDRKGSGGKVNKPSDAIE